MSPIYGKSIAEPEKDADSGVSFNTRYFKNLLYSSPTFNRTILFHKNQVNPDLVRLLRNNPDVVMTNQTNI